MGILPLWVIREHPKGTQADVINLELSQDAEARRVNKHLERIATTTDGRGVYRREGGTSREEVEAMKQAGFVYAKWSVVGKRKPILGWAIQQRRMR